MNAYALHAPTDTAGVRWTVSAAVILAVHAGLIAGGIFWYARQPPPAGVDMPAIMIDMAPATAAPEISQQDLAPGPEMTQADEPMAPPEPERQPAPVEQQIAPTPPVEKPVVEAPPEQKAEPVPTPPPEPTPAEAIPEPPKPTPVRPPPEAARSEVRKKPGETAPRTSAPSRAERRAAAASAATAGAAAAAALPSYRDRLAAHLQRYKQYPESAKSAGRQGVAMLSFTVSRSGQVLGARLAGSSGVAELDAETMSLIRRAQPLPAFPPEMTQSSLSFTVPVRFSIR